MATFADLTACFTELLREAFIDTGLLDEAAAIETTSDGEFAQITVPDHPGMVQLILGPEGALAAAVLPAALDEDEEAEGAHVLPDGRLLPIAPHRLAGPLPEMALEAVAVLHRERRLLAMPGVR